MKKWTLFLAAIALFGGCTEKQPEQVESEPAVLSSTDELQATSGEFGPREEMPGAALYAENCAHCHGGQVPKAPHLSWLEMMTPDAVLASMNAGVMAPQSAALDDEQRVDIAQYITRARVGSTVVADLPMCTDGGFDLTRPPAAVGWGTILRVM